jgi:26S proteasome regulatory subunit T2
MIKLKKKYFKFIQVGFDLNKAKMSLSDDVDLEGFINSKDDLTGADIKAMCTEVKFYIIQKAGLLALRERRMKITKKDFEEAKEKVLYLKKGNIPEGLYL